MLNRRAAITVVAHLSFTASFAAVANDGIPKVGSSEHAAKSQWSKDKAGIAQIRQQVKTILGNNQARYVNMHFELKGAGDAQATKLERTSLYEQFAYVMSGPPQPEYSLPSGYRLLSNLEPHNPSVRAIVITNGASSTIVALAMLHHFCGSLNSEETARVKSAKNPCETDPTLSILYPKGADKNKLLEQELIEYTKTVFKSGVEGINANGKRSLRVQVRQLN
jgi:hypothetical protein